MNITFNTYPTTTMPSVCAGPFTVSFSARPIACCAEYELSLCAYDSNSYSHYSVQDEDRLYLIPRWRFLDTDFNIVSSLPISTVSGVDGISGTASFWYIDDMPAPDIKINVEVRNIINYPVSSCNISAIMGTTSASDMISLSVGEWTPQLVKYTSDGISDISAKWTEHPIKWYATLHQELSGPIIFSYSYNLTSDLVSVSSEFCPLTAEVLSFDKSGNYGWIDGSCITDLSSLNASITGNAILTNLTSITGTSNEFKIRPFEQPFEIRRLNESWDATKSIKSYAIGPHMNIKYSLWDEFVGHSVGQAVPGQQLGRKSYERIANFPANHIDIDQSNVKQLYSLAQYLDVPIDEYDLNYPPELQRLLDIGSVSHSKLWGEIVKCNLNITDDQICPRCGYRHTNLGEQISDPFTYTVTAGVPFIQHDKFNLSPDGWTIEYPPMFIRIPWEIVNINGLRGTPATLSTSDNGQYIILCNGTGVFANHYMSNDYGETWSNVTAGGYIASVNVSPSGKYMTLAYQSTTIKYSDDYGDTWSTLSLPYYNVHFGAINNVQINDAGDMIEHCHDASSSHQYVYYKSHEQSTWPSRLQHFAIEYMPIGWSPSPSFNYYAFSNANLSHSNLTIYDLENNIISSSRYVLPVGAEILNMSDDKRVYIFDRPNSKLYYIDENETILHQITISPEITNIDKIKIDYTGQIIVIITNTQELWNSYDGGTTYVKFVPSITFNHIIDMSESGETQLIHADVTRLLRKTDRFEQFFTINHEFSMLCNTDDSTYEFVSSYPMTTLTAYDIDLCSYYDYYEYINDYPRLETCKPLASAYIQAAGVINRNDEYNTLDVYAVSSIEDWFGDDGKLQEAIEYELLRGLQLNSQTCNVSS